jgi:phage I-like protein
LTNNLDPLVAKAAAEQPHKEEDMLKKLIAKLKMAETATEDQVMAAIDGILERGPEIKEVIAKDILTALELADGDASACVASIHALKQAPKGMVSRTEYDVLVAKITQKDADEAVAIAMKTGKITPDQKDWATTYAKADLKGFETFVAKAPVVIPMGTLPEQKTKTDPLIDDAVLAVAKMFGNTVEDIKKYGMTG